MIVALREAGDGNRSDNAGAGERDGECAAVACVVGCGQGVLLLQRDVARLEREANGIAAAIETGYHVGFPTRPLGVVRRRAVQSDVEEWRAGLVAELRGEATDVDNDAELALDGQLTQRGAELPGIVFVEGGPLQLALLAGDAVEVIFDLRHC